MTAKQIAKARRIILSGKYITRRLSEYGEAFSWASWDYYSPFSSPKEAMLGGRDMKRFSNRLDRYRRIQREYGYMSYYLESWKR